MLGFRCLYGIFWIRADILKVAVQRFQCVFFTVYFFAGANAPTTKYRDGRTPALHCMLEQERQNYGWQEEPFLTLRNAEQQAGESKR